jgi:hypothetical protein
VRPDRHPYRVDKKLWALAMGRVRSHPHLIQRILRQGNVAEFAGHGYCPATLPGGSAGMSKFLGETVDRARHPERLGAVPEAAGASPFHHGNLGRAIISRFDLAAFVCPLTGMTQVHPHLRLQGRLDASQQHRERGEGFSAAGDASTALTGHQRRR